MKLKIAIVIPLVLVALGGGVLFGIYWHQEKLAQEEAQVACIATAFPAVLIERNRHSIQNLLDDLQDTRATGPDGAPDPNHVLSEEIDQKFAQLSDELEIEPSAPVNLAQSKVTDRFSTMIPLFQQEAPAYFGDCVPLFRRIRSHCGSFRKMDHNRKACVQSYQADIGQVLDKHVSAN